MSLKMKVPISLCIFTLIPIISFLFVMSSLLPIYSPDNGMFGVVIVLNQSYKWQLLSASICFITTAAWLVLAGAFMSDVRRHIKK
jgi:uncharacterized membrane protein